MRHRRGRGHISLVSQTIYTRSLVPLNNWSSTGQFCTTSYARLVQKVAPMTHFVTSHEFPLLMLRSDVKMDQMTLRKMKHNRTRNRVSQIKLMLASQRQIKTLTSAMTLLMTTVLQRKTKQLLLSHKRLPLCKVCRRGSLSAADVCACSVLLYIDASSCI